MSKYVKGLLQAELKDRMVKEDISEFLVVSIKGISGNANNELRGELLKKNVKMQVVRNSLFKKALSELEMDAACDLFEGPSTLVYGGDSIVDTAKEIVDWKKKIKVLEIKGAYLDGQTLDEDGTKELSKMPNRSELQGKISAAAMSPGGKLAAAIISPAGIIAGCIKAIADKEDDQQAA